LNQKQAEGGAVAVGASAPRKSPWRAALAVFRVALGVGLLAWVLSRSGLGALAPVLSSPWVLLVLLGLSLFGASVEAERLRVLFGSAGLRLTRGLAWRVVPVGSFFNFCVPGGTGGDVVKLYYLAKENPGRGVEVATVVLVDRVVALAAVLMLVLALVVPNLALVRSSAILRAVVLTAAAGLAAIAVVVALAWSKALRDSRLYAWMMERMPLRRYVERVADALHAFRDRKAALVAAALISLCGHIGVAATYMVVASVILPAVAWPVVGFLSMLGMVANALPLTPGGLGVGEAAFEQLFGLAGATGGAALLVLWRMSMIPIATIGATLYMTGRIRVERVIDRPQATPAERTA
jgi:hypothetical protein